MTVLDDATVVAPSSTDLADIPFADLGLPERIVRQLDRSGFTTAFPIQSAVIPDVLAGRDVAGRAPTGSGKTLGFGLPMVANLRTAESKRPTALVLAPTRELAEQIMRELTPYAKAQRHWTVAVYGGVGYGTQTQALARGTELVIACPGRLEDLLQMGAVDLSDVETVVVDEADQMSDMGFLPAVRRILDQTSPNRQVLLFSATLEGPVAKLVDDYQRDPVRHEVGPKAPDMTSMRHAFWTVPRSERIATTADVVDALGSTIVFTRTRHGADRLAKQLGKKGVRAEAIHGGRSQGQRNRALDAFKSGKCAALIATDVAARGIHVDGVSAVVHYDPPADGATYVHRSGRTARAGASGAVVTLVDPSQRKDVRTIAREAGVDFDLADPSVDELCGVRAHVEEPVPVDFATTPAPAGHERGVVKFFNAARGYGFIHRERGGDDLFVHFTNIATEGFKTLDQAAHVTFQVRSGKRGPEAFEVQLAH
jgi:superfamily II DNA/RNA helicase/cold shock CspA family protein